MKTFYSFLFLEFRRFFTRRNVVVFVLFLVLCLYFVQDGVTEYKEIVGNKEEFQKIEKANTKKFVNYTQYGIYGFRLMFIPSPLTAFFVNSGVIPELTAFVDSGVRLRLYHSILGKNLYAVNVNRSSFMDFSGVLLLFGSLFALFMGYHSLRRIEYIKYLSSLLNYKKIYFLVVGARIILIFLLLLFIIGFALTLIKLNHIALSAAEYTHLLVYTLITFLMVCFFLFMGIAAGSVKSKTNGMIAIAALWFGFVFLIPGTISKIIAKKADHMTSAYNLEQEKLKILTDFEKKAFEKTQRYKSIDEKKNSDRLSGQSYWVNEFKRIQSIEKRMENEIRENARLFQNLSLIFPTSFYIAAANEINSRGYENVIDFYAYVQTLKEQFVRYYINKKFYSNYSTVESFVKGDENIFWARSRLPGNLAAGMAFTLLFIVGFFVLSFFRFKRFLFNQPGTTAEDINGLDVELKEGETYVLLTSGSVINNQLYNFFSGEAKGFKEMVRLNNVNLALEENKSKRRDFTYLCHPGKVPGDINVGDFITFIKNLLKASNKAISELYIQLGIEHIEDKCFMEISAEEIGRILLAAAKLNKSKIYMFQDFVRGTPADFVTRFIEELQTLKDQGAAILYLTDDVLLASKIGDSAGSLRATTPPKLDTYNLV